MTPRRYARIRSILDRRQPDLTVLMEKVSNAHNLSAIVRTADAVGLWKVHAVSESPSFRAHHDSSAGSGRWVGVKTHGSTREAVQHLRDEGHQILAAHLAPNATDFRALDYTRPTALLVGAEREGVSDEAVSLADGFVIIPMLGAVASLNVSVATAVILYEAQRQRSAAGLYERVAIDEAELQQRAFELGHPRLADYCRRKGVPYPRLGPGGEILDSLPRG